MRVVAGVDCHKKTHSIVFIDAVGTVLFKVTIPANDEGYSQAIEHGSQFGEVEWGLEGTGLYGHGFADALLKTGAVVYEVPGAFTKRHRRHASRLGKSDVLDAQAIAEAVLREYERLPKYQQFDEQEAMRLVYDRRDRLVRQRTEAINRVRAIAIRLALGQLPKRLNSGPAAAGVLSRVKGLRGGSYTVDALVDEIEEALGDVQRLNETVNRLERELRPFVSRLAPELCEVHGVSTIVAAGLIGHSGNLVTCRNAAAFAMRAGAAPVPCSSGRNFDTVRLNLGGDRQLNRALHVVALTQIRTVDHAGRNYYERKRGEGKTHRGAVRALKRQLATVVFLRLRLAGERFGTTVDVKAA
jgi:transposase